MATARMALPATSTAAIPAANSSSTAAPPGNFKLWISARAPSLFRNSLSISHRQRQRIVEHMCLAVEGTETVAKEESVEANDLAEEEDDSRRKLYVVNLPWNFTAPEMRDLFGQCGTVKDVEIIKQKGGRGRGFAFITMGSPEEARDVIEKFDSFELQERIIRVEFAKSMKKPPRPAGTDIESRYKIYVSNLAWKVRSNNLKEFFAGNFKPISARVVFDTPTGRAAGYGFVSFSSEEEMVAAISELDGKELMGRPIRLKVSERKEG